MEWCAGPTVVRWHNGCQLLLLLQQFLKRNSIYMTFELALRTVEWHISIEGRLAHY